jgi:hypothetical protein
VIDACGSTAEGNAGAIKHYSTTATTNTVFEDTVFVRQDGTQCVYCQLGTVSLVSCQFALCASYFRPVSASTTITVTGSIFDRGPVPTPAGVILNSCRYLPGLVPEVTCFLPDAKAVTLGCAIKVTCPAATVAATELATGGESPSGSASETIIETVLETGIETGIETEAASMTGTRAESKVATATDSFKESLVASQSGSPFAAASAFPQSSEEESPQVGSNSPSSKSSISAGLIVGIVFGVIVVAVIGGIVAGIIMCCLIPRYLGAGDRVAGKEEEDAGKAEASAVVSPVPEPVAKAAPGPVAADSLDSGSDSDGSPKPDKKEFSGSDASSGPEGQNSPPEAGPDESPKVTREGWLSSSGVEPADGKAGEPEAEKAEEPVHVCLKM